MRILFLLLALVTAAPLQAQDAALSSFRLGGFHGGTDVGAVRTATEMFVDMGGTDLQLGATIASVGEEDNQNDLRLILSRAVNPQFRLGVSAAIVPNDLIDRRVGIFGLHFLFESPSQYFEGAFLVPDHINFTGAFSYDIVGEQRITEDVSVTTHLYRLSTDPENPDMYSIELGTTYDLSDRLTLIGEGFQTRADDYHFDNVGGRIGLTYRITSDLSVTAKLIRVIPTEGETSNGVSIMAEYAFGDPDGGARLFRTQPLPDRFALAAF